MECVLNGALKMVDNMISAIQGANAYANTAKIAGQGGVSGGDGAKFADLIKNAAEDSIETMKASEKVSAQAITGDASLTDVVQAVNEAELTLQSVVAVRNKMLQAYKDIMQMPI